MSNTICSLPWNHLATHPHGGVTLCCIASHVNGESSAKNFNGEKVIWLNLNKNTVEEIMNSDYYKRVRLDMMMGREPKACKRCYDEERAGQRSKRQEENSRYLNLVRPMIAHTLADGTIEPEFHFIELRLGNICGLKCRTCNPASSSSWIKEYANLETKLPFITKYGWLEKARWWDNDEFWDDLLNKSHSLRRIYVNGGEPTMMPKHYKYLEKLIELGYAEQIEIWYNINLTDVPEDLVRLWKQFKSCQVSASIDDLYERNEYIRAGSNWEETIENFEKLRSIPWINLSVVQTISSYNVLYLADFYNFFTKQRGIHIHMNWVYDPDFQSPWHLPDDIKQRVYENSEILPAHIKEEIHRYVSQPRIEEKYQQFLDFNRELDLIRYGK